MGTKIEWCDETINPVVGCEKISEGCQNCYAGRFAKRGMCDAHSESKAWDGTFAWQDGMLEKVAKWKKPRNIFVGSMTDIFHDDMPLYHIDRIMGVVGNPDNKRHTFMFLTKRPKRMRKFFADTEKRSGHIVPDNLWLGVSAENQARANERIPILLDIPAKVRFVSCEPMLGPIDLKNIFVREKYQRHDGPWMLTYDVLTGFKATSPYSGIDDAPTLDWVICGAETGTGKRPMAPEWANNLRCQCNDAVIPFFFKKTSAGKSDLMGYAWHQFPEVAV